MLALYSLTIPEYILLCMMLLGGTIAQVLMKVGSMRIQFMHNRAECIFSLLRNIPLIIGTILLVLDTLLLVLLLRSLPLIYVMPFLALLYVFVPLASCFFLKERVDKVFWIGALFLVAGITISVW